MLCPMVLQDGTRSILWRKQLETQLRTSRLREMAHIRRNYEHLRSHDAVRKELAAEKQQHGDTKQQLSAVKQDKLHIVNELKVRLCCLILLQVSIACFESCLSMHAASLQCFACQRCGVVRDFPLLGG